MTIAIRNAWLQKHPSPAASRGEFHWYPADGDRELRASFVERSRGIDAPAVLWQLAPGRVSWARVFAAIAPVDGRRYVGLVLTTAEAEDATLAELLEALEVPAAAPWSEADEPGRVIAAPTAGPDRRLARARRWSVRSAMAGGVGEDGDEDARAAAVLTERRPGGLVDAEGSRRWTTALGRTAGAESVLARTAGAESVLARTAGADGQPAVLARGAGSGPAELAHEAGAGSGPALLARGAGPLPDDGSRAEVAAIARALLGGGDAVLAEPDRPDLPRLVASVERWMPPAVANKPRWGAWRTGAASQAPDRVAGLIAAAWREPASRAAQGWELLCELAAAKERGVDEVAAELAAAEQPAAALTDAERAALGEAHDFAATLHAWGRGRLDAVASAASLPSRLADVVALRVLACLVADRDPRGAIAEARWHALLPAARRAALLDEVARRAASLRALVEVSHA